MSHFICLAEFIAKAGKEQELKDSLSLLIEPTRKEEGCIRYDLNQDIHHPQKITMIEIFTSKEAFDFHSKQAYLDDFKKVVDSLASSMNKTFGTTFE